MKDIKYKIEEYQDKIHSQYGSKDEDLQTMKSKVRQNRNKNFVFKTVVLSLVSVIVLTICSVTVVNAFNKPKKVSYYKDTDYQLLHSDEFLSFINNNTNISPDFFNKYKLNLGEKYVDGNEFIYNQQLYCDNRKITFIVRSNEKFRFIYDNFFEKGDLITLPDGNQAYIAHDPHLAEEPTYYYLSLKYNNYDIFIIFNNVTEEFKDQFIIDMFKHNTESEES